MTVIHSLTKRNCSELAQGKARDNAIVKRVSFLVPCTSSKRGSIAAKCGALADRPQGFPQPNYYKAPAPSTFRLMSFHPPENNIHAMSGDDRKIQGTLRIPSFLVRADQTETLHGALLNCQYSERASRMKRPTKGVPPADKPVTTFSAIQSPPKAALAVDKRNDDDRLHSQIDKGTEAHPVSPLLGATITGRANLTPDAYSHGLAAKPSRGGSPKPGEVDSERSFPTAYKLAQLLAVATQNEGLLVERVGELTCQRQDHLKEIDRLKGEIRALTDARDEQGMLSNIKSAEQIGLPQLEKREISEKLQIVASGVRPELSEQERFWKKEYDMKYMSLLEEQDIMKQKLHVAQKAAVDHEDAANVLRRQLLELKQNVSALTHMQYQLTDSDIAEHMGQMFHESRDWVVNNFRRSKISKSSRGLANGKWHLEALYWQTMLSYRNLQPAQFKKSPQSFKHSCPRSYRSCKAYCVPA